MSANRLTVGALLNNNTLVPRSLGLCENDLPGTLSYFNPASERLINAAGQTGWYGTWSKVIFEVSNCMPYITLPRQFSRIINLAFCKWGGRLQNQFFELLEASIGLQSFNHCRDWCGATQGFDRGHFPTMMDISPTNQQLVLYATDPRDIAAGARLLVGPCLDQNGNPIYSSDGPNQVNGFYITAASPFAVGSLGTPPAPVIVTHIDGIQKDATYGDFLLYQQDATTGVEVLLSRYGPDEVSPWYRRYFLKNPPCACTHVPPNNPCLPPATPSQTAHITAMCKMAYIPANLATDFLILQHIEGTREAMMSIRFSMMDSQNSDSKARSHWANAMQLFNQQLYSEHGIKPAVNYAPFGTARLERRIRAVRYG